jgi:hypothetical protein
MVDPLRKTLPVFAGQAAAFDRIANFAGPTLAQGSQSGRIKLI